MKFLVISAQLALLLVLLRIFDIEPGSGVSRILPLVFIGFLVHSALPLRYRLQFFLLLSAIAIGLVLGLRPGALLVVLGLGLIGLSHLPVAFSIRLILLACVAGALAALRAGWRPALLGAVSPLGLGALSHVVLPVLGSMFMFRLVIYLYDLRHEERDRAPEAPGGVHRAPPATVWTRLSYFFLLPNVCFLLFPVVDYRTYRRTYYDSDSHAIYQKGVWWICLGFVYLLLYRLVYHYLVLSPGDINGLGGVARFLLASYLIYVRVVGQFHLITGILCLFGFNLPPAHRFFLLASGFTDFWRRTRIDWKDFMVKVFYYPVLVPLQRKWGKTTALVLGTTGVFVATWLLHAVQWFWLRGDFRLSLPDAVFWGVFGACVLVNLLLEARGPRKRPVPRRGEWMLGAAVVHALKVLGMFIFLCVLWSYWSSQSPSDWVAYISAARDSRPSDYAVLLASLVAVLSIGVAAQLLASRISWGQPRTNRFQRQPVVKPFFGWRPVAVSAVTALLLIVAMPASRGAFGAPSAQFAGTLLTNRLNEPDQERQDRGYYERLLEEPRSIAIGLTDPRFGAPQMATSARQAESGEEAQPEHVDTRADSKTVEVTHDILQYQLRPSYSGSVRGQPFSTNRWGMRDKDYEQRHVAGTYRIALLGNSYEMASGFRQSDGFESIVEDSLNRVAPAGRKYEILNFSVGGYSIVKNVAVAERKVPPFKPDALFYAIHSNEAASNIVHLIWIVRNRVPIPYPYLQEKLRETGAKPDMVELRLRHRLAPITNDIIRWGYRRIVELCHQNGMTPVALVVPRTDETKADQEKLAQYAAWAREAGFTVLSLEGAYGAHSLEAISLSPADRHPNELGHRLLAERLYQELRGNDGRTLNLGLSDSR